MKKTVPSENHMTKIFFLRGAGLVSRRSVFSRCLGKPQTNRPSCIAEIRRACKADVIAAVLNEIFFFHVISRLGTSAKAKNPAFSSSYIF